MPELIKTPTGLSESQRKITQTCDNIKKFLLVKNQCYGNSALQPIHIFSRKGPGGGSIESRIDDKLSRVKNNDELRKNDVVDLIGYLILLCIKLNWSSFDEFLD